MLPVSLLYALKEYAVAQKALPTAVKDAANKSGTQLEVGQKLQGTVQAQVAQNIFKVNVSGQLVQMQLPTFVRSGDTVALQVISLQPRLTFGMVNSETPLSTPEQLGATARMLSSLSQRPSEKANVNAIQSSPLWDSPNPPESKQLAGMLHEALTNSGLFYESHQVQWLGGERSTAQLLQEPQNMSPQPGKSAVDDGGNKPAGTEGAKSPLMDSVASKATNSVTTVGGKDFVLTGENNVSIAAKGDGFEKAVGNSSLDANAAKQPGTSALPESKATGIPDHLQPLVQQQLNALETRQMLWQGNIWPGQNMKWEVHEQAPRAQDSDAQRQWSTQIQLDLPNLGSVAATLRLNSAGLSLTLNADSSNTRAVLGNASSRLVSALSDAGIPVLSTQVMKN